MVCLPIAFKTTVATVALALTTALSAASSPPVQPVGADHPAICAPEGERLRSLQAAPGDDTSIGQSITWAPSDPPDFHGLTGNPIRLSGACATYVAGYNLGQAVLTTGEGFTFTAHYAIESSATASRATAPDSVRGAPATLGVAKFVMATRVQSVMLAGALQSDYLGLWNGPDGSVVASFRVSQNGAATTPRVLFTSSAPLRSVSFFPAPDSAAGSISLAQITGPEEVQLFTYRWNHAAWFGR